MRRDSAADLFGGRVPISGLDPRDQFTRAVDDGIAVADTSTTLPPGGRQMEALLRDRPDLAQLEGLYRQALGLLAASRPLPARDVLFILKGETVATVPADNDSLSHDYLRSLDRRVSLLAGVVAEEQLLNRAVAADDSLVAAVYDEMRGLSLPDSLIPVTGSERRAIDTDLVSLDHELVDKWLDYFTGPGRGQMQAWLDRKAAVDSLVDACLDEAGLPRDLVWLCAIESGFNPRARSGAGAVGPWQFMAGTARHFGLRCDWWVDERAGHGAVDARRGRRTSRNSTTCSATGPWSSRPTTPASTASSAPSTPRARTTCAACRCPGRRATT